MDVTPIVVWLVIWGVMIFASIPLGSLLGIVIGFFTGAISDNEDVGAPHWNDPGLARGSGTCRLLDHSGDPPHHRACTGVNLID